MNRRNFLKLSSLTGAGLSFCPGLLMAEEALQYEKIRDGVFHLGDYPGQDLRESTLTKVKRLRAAEYSFNQSVYDQVVFSSELHENVNAQIQVVFNGGGNSELPLNLTNFAEMKEFQKGRKSQWPNNITVTENGFWSQAGGEAFERMLAAKQASVVRTIYRTKDDTKSHGRQITQNLGGHLALDKSGISTEVIYHLLKNGKLDENSVLPLITISGDSEIFRTNSTPTSSPFFRPSSVGTSLDNPYALSKNGTISDAQRKLLADLLTQRAQMFSGGADSIFKKLALNKITAEQLAIKLDEIKETEIPVAVPNNGYARALANSAKILSLNGDSRFLFYGEGVSSDAHSNFVSQATGKYRQAIEALETGVQVAESFENKRLIVFQFTEFGRTADLNDGAGVDHGNCFNLILSGTHPLIKWGKIIGETRLDTGRGNRAYLGPKDGSLHYEPAAIASTIYFLFGIQNPQVLTGEAPILELLDESLHAYWIQG